MAIGSSCTITEETHGTVKKITFAWAVGSASSSAVTASATSNAYSGAIKRLVTVPDGSSAPSAECSKPGHCSQRYINPKGDRLRC